MIYRPEINEQDSCENSNETVQNDCQEKLKQLHEQYAYLAADFDNYRKRQELERVRQMVAVQASVFRDLLPVIDDLERAVSEARKRQDTVSEAGAVGAVIEGVALIEKNMQKLREKYQLQEVPTNGAFDPELHEAIMHVDAPDKESGAIVAVLEKGFTIRSALLRPARVSVAR